MKIPRVNISTVPHHPGKWRVRWYEKDADGVRHQRCLLAANKKDAEQKAAEKRAEFADLAAAAKEEAKIERAAARRGDNVVILAALSAVEKMALVQAMGVIREAGGAVQDLVEAAKEFSRRHFGGKKISVGELVAQHVAWVTSHRTKATADDRRKQLRTFAEQYRDVSAWAIDLPEARAWCKAGSSENVQRARKRALSALYSWGIANGLVESNPTEHLRIEQPGAHGDAAIFSADEAARIMRAAEDLAPSMVPYYAIGFFGGLRPLRELRGVREEDIDGDRGLVLVTKHTAKTHRSRLVPISQNLAEWLAAYPVRGKVRWSKRLHAKVVTAAAVTWIQDGMRHTRASMRIAAGTPMAQVADEDGHSIAVLQAHYANRIIPRAEAEKFWNIMPSRRPAGVSATPRSRRSEPHGKSHGPRLSSPPPR